MFEAEDRRRKRSGDPLVALHYQLAQTRSEGRFDAVVVADDAGVVVAGAGTWAVCEELAAYAPLLAQGGGRDGSPSSSRAASPSSSRAASPSSSRVDAPFPSGSRIAAMCPDVAVRTVALTGQTVLLCVRGARGDGSAMTRAAEGVARILA